MHHTYLSEQQRALFAIGKESATLVQVTDKKLQRVDELRLERDAGAMVTVSLTRHNGCFSRMRVFPSRSELQLIISTELPATPALTVSARQVLTLVVEILVQAGVVHTTD